MKFKYLSSILAIIAVSAGNLLAQNQNPPAGRMQMPEMPKPGPCALPILPALPARTDSSFFAVKSVPHGKVEQVVYKTSTGEEKRMHIYFPPDYDINKTKRYPVLYLNHGGGDDDSKWSASIKTDGGCAGSILDNLIAEKKAKPMIIVMPNTRNLATFEPTPPGQNDKCSAEYVNDIIPYVDSHYRTIAGREGRAMAGLSMGGMVVMHTGFPHLDVFSELYVYSSGHISPETLAKFESDFSSILKDPKTNNLFRVPIYFAAGETDIALNNCMKLMAVFNKNTIRNFWVLSDGGHDWNNWRRYLYQTAQVMFPDNCK
jgi:enterochelin esterase-like enzyme